jgi:multidrug efflux pump subunit AcrA (membrane-fusion protein)
MTALPQNLSAMDIPRPRSRRRLGTLIAGGVVAVLAALTFGISRLSNAVPSVARTAVWVDTVKRGELKREVRAPGTLVPEQIRWVSSAWPARVEDIYVKPGTKVDADTVLLKLSNPDLELQALEAERQLASTTATIVDLETQGASTRLIAEGALATLNADSETAKRKAQSDRTLSERGMIATQELQTSLEKTRELSKRVELEQRRLDVVAAGLSTQLAAQREQLKRLKAVAEFRRQQVEGLTVRAGIAGVLEDLPLERGQWVAAGVTLAKVARPDALKAELHIAEAQAHDVTIGQRASIDTRHGIVPGVVTRVDPAVLNATVKVDVALEGPLPKGARPDLSVDGSVELERLPDVLFVGRPAFAQNEGPAELFRLEGDGAVKVGVTLGRGSVALVEVTQGLKEGDAVILSDMSQYDSNERVQLK